MPSKGGTPMCECGHDAKAHLEFVATADCLHCDCKAFVLRAPPLPPSADGGGGRQQDEGWTKKDQQQEPRPKEEGPMSGTISHSGARASNCPTCIAYAESVAHLYHPDSDVGPYDGACPMCSHFHEEGEDCITIESVAVSARDAALEEAARIADAHWPESGHVPPHGAVSCAMSISISIRRLKSQPS